MGAGSGEEVGSSAAVKRSELGETGCERRWEEDERGDAGMRLKYASLARDIFLVRFIPARSDRCTAQTSPQS